MAVVIQKNRWSRFDFTIDLKAAGSNRFRRLFLPGALGGAVAAELEDVGSVRCRGAPLSLGCSTKFVAVSASDFEGGEAFIAVEIFDGAVGDVPAEVFVHGTNEFSDDAVFT